MMKTVAASAALLALVAGVPALLAQAVTDRARVGPSPYDVVRGWHKPFAAARLRVRRQLRRVRGIAEPHLRRAARRSQAARSGAAGVRRLCRLNRDQRAQRHRPPRLAQLPLHARRRRQRQGALDAVGSPLRRLGRTRARIGCASARTIPSIASGSINETFHQIYVFSNDGSKLLKTLGEKNVPGSDGKHFAKPQDVAFLPDGRILVADGLDNHRVMILDTRRELHLGVRRLRQRARPVQRRARRGGRTAAA